MLQLVPDTKLIRLNSNRIDGPDDPSLPFKLEIVLQPPGFMEVAFVLMYGGSEELVMRGLTREALEEFITKNNFRTHPRLRHLTITGPNGVVEQFPKK